MEDELVTGIAYTESLPGSMIASRGIETCRTEELCENCEPDP